MGDSVGGANKGTWTSFLKSIATFSGDLSTLTAPSFILSGTSILEYSSYWGEHPELFCDIANGRNAEERMIAVTKWYTSTLKGSFSARHTNTGGEKKPLNPVLGETFHGTWQSKTGTTELTAEQVSHHPPISAYRIKSANGVTLQGHNGQKSGFSGRTIIVRQIGHTTLTVPVGNSTETYLITLPQLSLEGLFFGSPYAELVEKSHVISSSGWVAENEYSGKGWVSGKKNTIKTRIFEPSTFEGREKSKYIIEGQWTDRLTIRQRSEEQEGTTFVDSAALPPIPITHSQSDEVYESRRLWAGVAVALKNQDYESASRLKSEIEQAQRDLRKSEKAAGTVWRQKYFAWRETVPGQVQALMDTVGCKSAGEWEYIYDASSANAN